MIIDARTLPPDTEIDADVCIVGTGPAGLAIAREFLHRNLDVVMLEAGGAEETTASQAFYEGENLGLPYDLSHSRYRMFGGSGAHWGGYTALLDASDFDAHPWIPLSGWPLAFDELQPYYGRALRWLGFEERDYDPEYWVEQGEDVVRFPAGTIRNKIWRFNRLRFGEVLRGTLDAAINVRVLLHAPVTSIKMNAARSEVQSVTVGRSRDTALTVRARRYVIACGGLETPRLLLTAGPGFTPLVHNDNVGRFFMEHYHVVWQLELALFTAAARSRLYQQCGVIDDCCEVRAFFQLDPELRREHGLTNVIFKVHHEAEPDSMGPGAGELINRLQGRRSEFGTGSISVMAEQVPNPSSRVTLSDERDSLGVPRLRLDWRSTTLDNHSVYRSAELLAARLGVVGAGRLRFLPRFQALEFATDFNRDVKGGDHHLGTARMSDTPRHGVVDPDCRLHGVANCYLAGSSVFSTSGAVNPTLTILALSMRLADHLAASLWSSDS